MSRPSLSVPYSEYLVIKEDNDLLKEQLRHLCEIIKETGEENLKLKTELQKEKEGKHKLYRELLVEKDVVCRLMEEIRDQDSISKIQSKRTLYHLKLQARPLENFVEEDETPRPVNLKRNKESVLDSYKRISSANHDDYSYRENNRGREFRPSGTSLRLRAIADDHQRRIEKERKKLDKIDETNSSYYGDSLLSKMDRVLNQSLSFNETSDGDWHTAIQDTTHDDTYDSDDTHLAY